MGSNSKTLVFQVRKAKLYIKKINVTQLTTLAMVLTCELLTSPTVDRAKNIFVPLKAREVSLDLLIAFLSHECSHSPHLEDFNILSTVAAHLFPWRNGKKCKILPLISAHSQKKGL